MGTARRSGDASDPAWPPAPVSPRPPPLLAVLALLALLALPNAPASASLPPASLRADLRDAPLVASAEDALRAEAQPAAAGDEGETPANATGAPDAESAEPGSDAGREDAEAEVAPGEDDADAAPPAGTADGDPYADTPGARDLYADDEEHDPYADDLILDEPDPYEGFNRAVFGFNQSADRFVVEPVARAYGWLMPDVAERAVLRFFANLNSTSTFVNDLLQLECRRAGVTLTRFVVNTTVGVAGFLDVANSLGMEGHHSDFGQTLALAGVPSGPYLVLPMAGPSTARDAVGSVVDLAFRPHTYFLGPTVILMVGGGSGIVTREAYRGELEALQASSVDFYATMRNIYFQRRAEQLRERGVEMEALKDAEEAEPIHAPDGPEERAPGEDFPEGERGSVDEPEAPAKPPRPGSSLTTE